ncbi:MAG: hypothetical protein PHO85_05450 [Candidatus Cloacimonetes bacterium]|jgi:hypothetical protein|nr:hypothetical protein [Candidatus Cloacimonadota bacterium]MDD2506008.1 hypothetical protein [Candidatus Cloacimonadota bacterium]MDD4147946.1 hypothetical protein [Candidatus Cloacimonadota bacterium]MDD4559237.1 hypothetical protein [Candidatus Cloacimonadota bacterium]
MKVKFKNLLMGYTGMLDDSVVYFSAKRNQYIIRRRPKFKAGKHNRDFTDVQKKIYAIQPSEEYRQDLRAYLGLYNDLPQHRDKPLHAWNLIYVKLMWNMSHILQIDLHSIDREQVLNLPCRTIAAACAAGLLPKVKGYETFTALI